jgi:hypothetical protein
MSTVKEEVESLLSRLPDDCSIEDIQYHLYVLEKVRSGLELADREAGYRKKKAERLLDKWLTK